MDKITIDRINLLHPLLRAEALEIYGLICSVLTAKTVCRFTHTLRTIEEQNALYAIGRTQPGKVVTNAKGGSSFHNYGLAIDFCLIIDGKASFKVDATWLQIIEIFEQRGWESGHRWKFTDSPHIQKTFGYTIAQLRAFGKTYPNL